LPKNINVFRTNKKVLLRNRGLGFLKNNNIQEIKGLAQKYIEVLLRGRNLTKER